MVYVSKSVRSSEAFFARTEVKRNINRKESIELLFRAISMNVIDIDKWWLSASLSTTFARADDISHWLCHICSNWYSTKQRRAKVSFVFAFKSHQFTIIQSSIRFAFAFCHPYVIPVVADCRRTAREMRMSRKRTHNLRHARLNSACKAQDRQCVFSEIALVTHWSRLPSAVSRTGLTSDRCQKISGIIERVIRS